MRNVDMSVKENVLTIKINLAERLGPSNTGKTIIVASTDGGVPVPGSKEIKIGINAYTAAK